MRPGPDTRARTDPGKAQTVTMQSIPPVAVEAHTQRRILVVDDEPNCAELFAEILRREGYQVRSATSGLQALELFRDWQAEVVITDMVMPGMDGMQLLARLKELYSDVEVVMLTGYGGIEDAVEAMRRGAADFLPKPFRPDELKRIVTSCLRKRSISRSKALLEPSLFVVQLSQAMVSAADTSTLLRKALALAASTFSADAAALFAYSASTETLSLLAHYGPPLSFWQAGQHVMEEALIAIRRDEVHLSMDEQSGECYAYVRLTVAGEARGVLCLRRDDGPWFGEQCTEPLGIFASHLALCVESMQLHENAVQQVAELEELLSAARTAPTLTDVGAIVRRLLSATRHFSRAQVAAVLLQEPRPLFEARPSLPPDSPLRNAVETRMAATLARVNNSTLASGEDDVAQGPLASFISAPLRNGSRIVGLVALAASEEGTFTVRDMNRLAMVATSASAALASVMRMERLTSFYHDSLSLLASAADSRSAFNLGHSRQVSTYARELARALNLADEEVCIIEEGALLHDVGKICVPDSILNKPGPLTEDEFAILATHTTYGAKMFEAAPHLSDLVPIVRHHHERYDGRGYPDGLQGEAIPLGARIVALGDALDALVSHRIYRPAATLARARKIMAQNSGTQFDPRLTEVFLSLPLENLIER